VIRAVLDRELSVFAWLRALENAVPFVCASVVGRSPNRVKKLFCALVTVGMEVSS
jgi:hypothetical protein